MDLEVGQRGDLVQAEAPVANEYIAVLDDLRVEQGPPVARIAGDLVARYGPDARVMQVYEHAVSGFSARMTAEAARDLAADPAVEYVEENARVELQERQQDPIWGLDRIDQRALAPDDAYRHGAGVGAVHAYVIDTGIRTSHEEFGGRAREAFTNIDDGNGAQDCHGHGTHVAGTIGSAEWGVAKGAQLHAVRVFDCDGRGATTASVVEAIEWVTAHAEAPAVVNMSLGSSASEVFDDAVSGSIEAGLPYVVAAGNAGGDACEHSPARVPGALTVGAMAKRDLLAHFSNTGDCVDLFAPGLGIDSTGTESDTDRSRRSGTSMAAPHVAGAVARYLALHPDAEPAEAHAALVDNATVGALDFIGDDWGPNVLLYTGFLDANPSVAITSPNGGALLVGEIHIHASATAQDTPVSRVEFELPDGSIVEDRAAPYKAAWDSATVEDDDGYTITAVAFDEDGDASETARVTVEVANDAVVTAVGGH